MNRIVRLSEESYQSLTQTAARLQLRLKRKVSLSEAAEYLACKFNNNARGFWSKTRLDSKAGRGRERAFLGTTLLHKHPLREVSLHEVHASINKRFPHGV